MKNKKRCKNESRKKRRLTLAEILFFETFIVSGIVGIISVLPLSYDKIRFLIYVVVIVSLLIPLALYESEKNAEKSNRCWKSEVSESLRRIENSFSDACQKITEESFSKYTDRTRGKESLKDYEFKSLYRMLNGDSERITQLAVEYKENVTEKATTIMGKHRLNVIPEDLQRAYEAEIDRVAYIYKSFLDEMKYSLCK